MSAMRRVSALLIAAACSLAAVTPAVAKPAAESPAAMSSGEAFPEGGVTIIATFSMQAYTYDVYREALSLEIPLMEKNGVKLVKSYRVLFGGMDKYFDIWWAPDYETAYKAFYEPEYTDPEFEEFLARTNGALINPVIEIVQEEKF